MQLGEEVVSVAVTARVEEGLAGPTAGVVVPSRLPPGAVAGPHGQRARALWGGTRH